MGKRPTEKVLEWNGEASKSGWKSVKTERQNGIKKRQNRKAPKTDQKGTKNATAHLEN
jgi:hypothetical protein